MAWSVVLASAIGAGFWAYHLGRSASIDLQALRAQAMSATEGAASAVAPQVFQADFTAALGAAKPPTRFLSALERATQDAGVVIAGTSVTEHAATPGELGRQEFTLILRGSYEGTKQVVGELAARFGGMTVRTMRMRQDPGARLLESTVVLSVWSAPRGDLVSIPR